MTTSQTFRPQRVSLFYGRPPDPVPGRRSDRRVFVVSVASVTDHLVHGEHELPGGILALRPRLAPRRRPRGAACAPEVGCLSVAGVRAAPN